MKKQVFFTIFLLFATFFVSAQTMWSARYNSDGTYEAQESGAAGPQTLINGASTGDKIVIYNQERLSIDQLNVGVEITIEYNYADTYTPAFECGDDVTFTYNGLTYGTVSGQNGTCWMDRNLGATDVAESSADADAYGDLYQWGRGADGHENRNSATYDGDTEGYPSTASESGEWDGKFILSANSSFDWLNPQNDDLWQGVSGTNNPCPSGYRLPTQAEWEAERASWGSNDAAGAFGSPLKLPVAGNRSYMDGSPVNVGSRGFYWSSTLDGTSSLRLYFYSGDALTMFGSPRATGISVRCLKD